MADVQQEQENAQRRQPAILVALTPLERISITRAAELDGQRLATWARIQLVRAANRVRRLRARRNVAAAQELVEAGTDA